MSPEELLLLRGGAVLAGVLALALALKWLLPLLRPVRNRNDERLQEVLALLGVIHARVVLLCTREDLDEAAEKNRHDYRNNVAALQVALQTLARDVALVDATLREHDTWERARRGQDDSPRRRS